MEVHVPGLLGRTCNRLSLVRQLRRYGGPGTIENGCNVTLFEERPNPTTGAPEVRACAANLMF